MWTMIQRSETRLVIIIYPAVITEITIIVTEYFLQV